MPDANIPAAVPPAPTFTPGPWLTRLHSSGDGAVVIYPRDCCAIGEAYAAPRITPEQATANAALIAAAPDLLAAAKGIQNLIRKTAGLNLDPRDIEEMAALWRAVEKAEGRP